MGASLVYLEKPNKDISFESGSDSNLEYVAGEMQGWRINMVSTNISNMRTIIYVKFTRKYK